MTLEKFPYPQTLVLLFSAAPHLRTNGFRGHDRGGGCFFLIFIFPSHSISMTSSQQLHVHDSAKDSRLGDVGALVAWMQRHHRIFHRSLARVWPKAMQGNASTHTRRFLFGVRSFLIHEKVQFQKDVLCADHAGRKGGKSVGRVEHLSSFCFQLKML